MGNTFRRGSTAAGAPQPPSPPAADPAPKPFPTTPTRLTPTPPVHPLDAYTKSTGLYDARRCKWAGRHEVTVRTLITSRRLAPRVCGLEEEKGAAATVDCPVCFLFYAPYAINDTSCCKTHMCTECYLHIQGPAGDAPCPFCQRARLAVSFTGDVAPLLAQSPATPSPHKRGTNSAVPPRSGSTPAPVSAASSLPFARTTPAPARTSVTAAAGSGERQREMEKQELQKGGVVFASVQDRADLVREINAQTVAAQHDRELADVAAAAAASRRRGRSTGASTAAAGAGELRASVSAGAAAPPAGSAAATAAEIRAILGFIASARGGSAPAASGTAAIRHRGAGWAFGDALDSEEEDADVAPHSGGYSLFSGTGGSSGLLAAGRSAAQGAQPSMAASDGSGAVSFMQSLRASTGAGAAAATSSAAAPALRTGSAPSPGALHNAAASSGRGGSGFGVPAAAVSAPSASALHPRSVQSAAGPLFSASSSSAGAAAVAMPIFFAAGRGRHASDGTDEDAEDNASGSDDLDEVAGGDESGMSRALSYPRSLRNELVDDDALEQMMIRQAILESLAPQPRSSAVAPSGAAVAAAAAPQVLPAVPCPAQAIAAAATSVSAFPIAPAAARKATEEDEDEELRHALQLSLHWQDGSE